MSIGFKEWALVCEALADGRQSIILRKGGIAEGRAGFRFQHPEFLFFPTQFHEQAAKMRIPLDTPIPHPSAEAQIELTLAATVEWTVDITNRETAALLEPFHLWQPSEIEKRFTYDEREGISLALLRVSRLSRPFVFPDAPKYGGCRSWVTLPDLPAETFLNPVLNEPVHRQREADIRQILASRNVSV